MATFCQHRIERVNELGASAVIERQHQPHAGVLRGSVRALFHVRADGVWKIFRAPDKQKANVVLLDGRAAPSSGIRAANASKTALRLAGVASFQARRRRG